MMASALAACGTAISYAVAWLDHLYSKVPGASTLVLVGFFIWTATRLLLRPIIGSAASDHARRFNKSMSERMEDG